MIRRLRGTSTWDAAWDDPSFARQVEVVRRQLAPIRSRRALAESFGREAFHVRRRVLEPDGGPTGPVGPVRLAYAICWLELGDGETRPAWAPGPSRRSRSRRTRPRSRRRPTAP